MSDSFAILAASRSTEPDGRRGHPHLWPLIMVVVVLLAVAVTVFGSPPGDSTATPTPSGTSEAEPRVYTVSYRSGIFSPTNLRIHTGDTVRFRNDSPLPVRITALPGQSIPEFDSVGPVPSGGYFGYTFATAGVFSYAVHGEEREGGTIIVR